MKHKFNWLDILISAVLIAALIGGLVWFFHRKSNEPQPATPKTYEITLQFNQTTTDPLDFYQVGETLYYQGGKKAIGTITNLQLEDLRTESLDEEQGKFIVATHPKTKVIVMTVQAQGVIENHMLKVNGEAIYIGKDFYPQSEKTRSAMTVRSIKEVA